jgi:uridine nucleosidase
MTFFAKTYKEVFGFQDGPPIHDALVVSYIARPELFTSILCRVDIERSGKHSRGALVVDIFNRKAGQRLNVELSRSLNVSDFPDDGDLPSF